MNTQASATNNQLNTQSFHTSESGKYGGLIQQSIWKIQRKRLIQIFSYVFSVAPNFAWLNRIISFFRIIQFIGPAFCASLNSLYKDGSIDKNTIRIMAILWQLVPPQFHEAASAYVLGIISGIYFIVIIIVFVSAYSFNRNAKLPGAISTIIALFFNDIGELFPVILVIFMFEEISSLTSMQHGKSEVAECVSLVVISAIVLSMYLLLFLYVSADSLTFRPQPLAAVLNTPQTLLWVSSLAINAIQALSVSFSTMGQIICHFIMAVIYLGSIGIPFSNGGFIKNMDNNIIIASSFSGFAFSVLAAVFLLMNNNLSLITAFVFIVLFVITLIVVNFLMRRITTKDLILLDNISDDSVSFSEIKSISKFLRVGVNGIKNSHPLCIEWRYFKFGAEKWNEDGRVWLIFAKMAAIYPEEIQTLTWIYHAVISAKVHGAASRCIKEQSLSLAKMREVNLSPELKYRINVVGKQVTSTKHKMRHVFDVIIQGNIGEMESSTKKLWTALEKDDADFKHLLRQYPNNRFVTRSYARFLTELLADRQECTNMIEKTRLLQRGIPVSPDEAHTLGLTAFPNLPDRLRIQKADIVSDISVSESVDIDTETNTNVAVDENDNDNLKSRIEKVGIPAIRNSIIARILFVVCLFVVPAIVLMIITSKYIDSSIDIISHMYNLAFVRTIDYQIAAFSHRYIFESLNQFGHLDPTGTPPQSLGSTFDTAEQVLFLLAELTATLQKVSNFKTFDKKSTFITEAKKMIFDPVTHYIFYITMTDIKESDMNVQTCLLDFIVQLTDLKKLTITYSTINTSVLLNPAYNADAITASINSALSLMSSYLTEVYNDSKKQCNMIFYIVMVGVIVVYLISLAIQLAFIKRSKEETYRALMALPKNAVSTLAENLRVLKKDNTENSSTAQNTEMSKQEENILKIFNTGGASMSTAVLDTFMLSATEILVIIMHIITTYLLTDLIIKSNKSIVLFAPHLDYLMGAYSNTVTMIFSIHNTLMSFYEHHIRLWDREGTINYFYLRTNQSRDYYYMARYGGPSIEETPFQGFAAALERAADQVACKNPYDRPTKLEDAVRCYDADITFSLIQPLMDAEVRAYKDAGVLMTPLDRIYSVVWNLLVFPVYDAFFSPMFETIVPTIEEQLSNFKSNTYPATIVLTVVAVIVELIAIMHIKRIEKHIRLVLRLLLHFPSSVVLQTAKAMKVLSGDFKSNRTEQTSRDDEFFNDVLANLSDAVFIADQSTFTIENANKACQRIFGTDNYIGRNLKEFFEKFEGCQDSLFTNSKSYQLVVKRDDGEEINIESTSLQINQKTVIVTRETTQTVRYNRLITAERNRSDQLLNSILPMSLVKRVQAGEKTISFEVQSATIMFMDIVSFTPWCGSLPAATVMATLNNLFKKFDASAANFTTITKIKCIGDCYMAAGGIFDTINQPATHAKEVVHFGLVSIDKVNELNEEIGEKLQIRVGVNTGGPIVAGVLGVGKPTFEILGPAINMAQQMEHNGVPMQVHISRNVYELIYGDSFIVKERGTIEVKGGKVLTYLVTSKA